MNHHSNDRRRLLQGLAAGAGLAPLGVRAKDATFPSKPIKLVVPFSASSGTDVSARTFAAAIGQISGQPVIVENKPGADGVIAAQAVLSAPADGYTVFHASNSSLTTNAALIKNLPYDPVRDFDLLGLLTGGYCVLAVPASSPYKTLDDLLADARKRPAARNNAAATPSYAIWNDWFCEIAGIKTVNIAYKGSGDAAQAVLGAHVDYSIVVLQTVSALIESGRVRALFYAGKERNKQYPSIPTVAEVGIPEFQALAWSASAVRAGTPPEITAKLAEFYRLATQMPEVRRVSEMGGGEVTYMAPADFRKYQKEEIDRWRRLIAATPKAER